MVRSVRTFFLIVIILTSKFSRQPITKLGYQKLATVLKCGILVPAAGKKAGDVNLFTELHAES